MGGRQMNEIFMAFPQPQHEAIFLQRTQRFLVLMKLADGTQELVYCANSGAMASNLSSGARAVIWDSGDLKRKRRFTWRAVETDGLWVGTEHALAKGYHVEAMFPDDVSGGGDFMNRPGMVALLSFLEAQ